MNKMPTDKEIAAMVAERLATHPTVRPAVRVPRRLALRMGAARAAEWIETQRAADAERCCEEG